MTTLEKTIEKYLVQQVEDLGGQCWKWTSPGRRGVPDRLVAFDGDLVPVELKTPTGELSKHQIKRIAELNRCGVSVFVLSSKHEVDVFIKIMLKYSEPDYETVVIPNTGSIH